MMNVKFNISSTQTRKFTTDQIAKVQAGIELLQRVVNNPSFKDRICNYSWSTSTGSSYNRFHLCNDYSNEQVWDCIQNACDWASPTSSKTINVVPCVNKEEMTNIMNTIGQVTPTVCVDVNCLNYEWYTPVHIASAMMYEYCTCCLGFTATSNGIPVTYWKNTVPATCATCVMLVAKEIAAEDSSVSTWFNSIAVAEFNCYPCSNTWCVTPTNVTWKNTCTQIDNVICDMISEMDCINNVMNKSSDEVNRLTTLTTCLETLNEMKTKLMATSLDGCEMISNTVLENTLVTL